MSSASPPGGPHQASGVGLQRGRAIDEDVQACRPVRTRSTSALVNRFGTSSLCSTACAADGQGSQRRWPCRTRRRP